METQSNILNELPIIVKSSTLQAGSNIPIDHQIEDWEQMFKINEHPKLGPNESQLSRKESLTADSGFYKSKEEQKLQLEKVTTPSKS